MKIKTKGKIVFMTNSVFLLFAVWVWWAYSNRSVLSFIGLVLLFNVIGITLGLMIVLPFKTEFPTLGEEYNESYIKRIYDQLQKYELSVQDKNKVSDQLLLAQKEGEQELANYGFFNQNTEPYYG